MSARPGEGELSEVQADAILNMRLRSLRRLEELELLREQSALMEERAGLEDLLESESCSGTASPTSCARPKSSSARTIDGGARRTTFAEAGEIEDVPLEAMIDREPITVVCSEMGWIRAMTGHIDLTRELKFKDGDGPRLSSTPKPPTGCWSLAQRAVLHAFGGQPARRARHGRTAAADGGSAERGEIVDLFIHQPERKLLVASTAGDGFVVPEDDVVAQTRSGKQVLNVRGDVKALVCKPVQGDHVAAVGENRKVLVFALDELPEMGRGKGVRMQKYKDGGLSDATTFNWPMGSAGWTRPAAPGPKPIWRNGPANAPAPGAWRRAVSRVTTGSADNAGMSDAVALNSPWDVPRRSYSFRPA